MAPCLKELNRALGAELTRHMSTTGKRERMGLYVSGVGVRSARDPTLPAEVGAIQLLKTGKDERSSTRLDVSLG